MRCYHKGFTTFILNGGVNVVQYCPDCGAIRYGINAPELYILPDGRWVYPKERRKFLKLLKDKEYLNYYNETLKTKNRKEVR
jgi:hypothetical protein